MLKLNNITFDYISSVPLIEDFSLEVKLGTLCALYGPSGRWKSTVLRILWGLLAPQKWEVLFGEDNIYDWSYSNLLHYRGQTVWMHFQDYALLYDLNIHENITLPFVMTGTLEQLDQDRYDELLKILELNDQDMNKSVSLLSWWQQERVWLVRALITKPDVLLLDEPGANLNEALLKKMYKLIETYSKDHVVVVATHNPYFTKLTNHICSLD